MSRSEKAQARFTTFAVLTAKMATATAYCGIATFQGKMEYGIFMILLGVVSICLGFTAQNYWHRSQMELFLDKPGVRKIFEANEKLQKKILAQRKLASSFQNFCVEMDVSHALMRSMAEAHAIVRKRMLKNIRRSLMLQRQLRANEFPTSSWQHMFLAYKYPFNSFKRERKAIEHAS